MVVSWQLEEDPTPAYFFFATSRSTSRSSCRNRCQSSTHKKRTKSMMRDAHQFQFLEIAPKQRGAEFENKSMEADLSDLLSLRMEFTRVLGRFLWAFRHSLSCSAPCFPKWLSGDKNVRILGPAVSS